MVNCPLDCLDRKLQDWNDEVLFFDLVFIG